MLGRVAVQQRFSSPEVAAGTEAFAQELDVPALRTKLGLAQEPESTPAE
jgi:hypothetical protein